LQIAHVSHLHPDPCFLLFVVGRHELGCSRSTFVGVRRGCRSPRLPSLRIRSNEHEMRMIELAFWGGVSIENCGLVWSMKRTSQHVGLLVYLSRPDLVNDNVATEADLYNS
jgi:hypothetical protein